MSALRMTERHTAANEQRQYIGVQKEGKGEKKGLDLYRSFRDRQFLSRDLEKGEIMVGWGG